MNELRPYFSNGVLELSGADDELHLKDVPFRHAPLNKTLQHLFLVQPDVSEKKQRKSEETQIPPPRTHTHTVAPEFLRHSRRLPKATRQVGSAGPQQHLSQEVGPPTVEERRKQRGDKI